MLPTLNLKICMYLSGKEKEIGEEKQIIQNLIIDPNQAEVN